MPGKRKDLKTHFFVPIAASLFISSSLRLSLGELPVGPVTVVHNSTSQTKLLYTLAAANCKSESINTRYIRIMFMLPFSMGFPPRRRMSHDSIRPLIYIL